MEPPWWAIIGVVVGYGLSYAIQTALWRREKSADYRERRMQAYAHLYTTLTQDIGQLGCFEDAVKTFRCFWNTLLAKAHLLAPEDFQSLWPKTLAVHDCIIERAILQCEGADNSKLQEAAVKTYDALSKVTVEMQSRHWEQIQQYLVSAGMKSGAVTMPQPLSPLIEAYRKWDESHRQTLESDKD